MSESTGFSNAPLEATQEIWSQLVGQKLRHVETKVIPISGIKGDLTVITHFKGEVTGAFILRLSRSLAQTLLTSMLGEDTQINEEALLDVSGEFLNMVIGSIKTRLSYVEEAFTFSIPTTVSGADYSINLRSKNTAGATSFVFQYGSETLTVDLVQEKA